MLAVRRVGLVAVALAVLVVASGCIVGEDRPNAINVSNGTNHTLTIYYDNPDPSGTLTEAEVEDLNIRTVLEPHSNGRFSLPEPDRCALVAIEARDEQGTAIDTLPAGTCHQNETIEWHIIDGGAERQPSVAM